MEQRELRDALHALIEQVARDSLDATELRLRLKALQQRARAARGEPLTIDDDEKGFEPHIIDARRCGWCGEYDCSEHDDLDPYAV